MKTDESDRPNKAALAKTFGAVLNRKNLEHARKLRRDIRVRRPGQQGATQ